MPETLPWSVPVYASVTDEVAPPWSAPVSVTVDARTIEIPPWSGPAQITLIAPPGIDWQPLTGTQAWLPTPAGHVKARTVAPATWPNPGGLEDMYAEEYFEVAHRGFGALRPEMTMEAYLNAARLEARSLEISVVRSSDGYFVCNHDENTLRMSGVDYFIPNTPWKGVIEHLDSNFHDTYTPDDPRKVPLCLLSDVVREFGRTHVLWIQPKRDYDAPALIDWLNQSAAYIDNQHGVLKLWKGSWPAAIYGKEHGGWQSWGIWVKGSSLSRMEYFDILGADWEHPQEYWDVLLATGKRVIAHVTESAEERDIAISKGASGFMSRRPVRDL